VTAPALVLRRAVEADRPRLAALLGEMQTHYKSENPPGAAEQGARLLTRAGERIPFTLVTERQDRLVGMAILNPVFYGGPFRWSLYLKDLYVSADARSLGLGRLLIAAIARTALEEDYHRIDWTAEGWNDGAQRFYDGLGIPRLDKRNYRLAGDDLKRLAGT
jgi:GNAT superfamily N-acetyltransferase